MISNKHLSTYAPYRVIIFYKTAEHFGSVSSRRVYLNKLLK